MATSTQAIDKLSGLIDRVTYFNAESGFAVLKVKASGHRDLVTVVGSLPSASAGEWLTAEGTWVRDREHGLQLKATVLRTVPPTTAEGIEKYLGSGMVKGIDPISSHLANILLINHLLINRFSCTIEVPRRLRPS
jgi:exodeoxyribonuclease V alpha subunit